MFGLGRGLGSLIPSPTGKKLETGESPSSIFYVETHKIKPNPQQPRKSFNDQGLKELAASIKRYGILQPLLVAKEETNTERGLDVAYQLVAGERRWRAACLLNLPQVPVVIKDALGEDRLKLELALVENLQREDLNSMEEAEAFARLQREFRLTQKEVAEKVGKTREVVANSLRFLELPPDIKESLRAGRISRTHARGLLAFRDPRQQKEIFRQILAGKMVAREVEQLAKNMGVTAARSTRQKSDSRFVELEKNLSQSLGTLVKINSREESGHIAIRFADLGELNKIVKTILD